MCILISRMEYSGCFEEYKNIQCQHKMGITVWKMVKNFLRLYFHMHNILYTEI